MSHLSQIIAQKQLDKNVVDRVAAEEISLAGAGDVSQQKYSSWKRGVIPRPNARAALAKWLGIPRDHLDALCEEAESESDVSLSVWSRVRKAGRIADRKEAKYKFDPVNNGRKRIPEGRYTMSIDTKVLEPVFRAGTQIWIDPAKGPLMGDEVVVHADGFGWVGVLKRWDASGATLYRPGAGDVTVKNVEAVHVVVLSSRS